MAVRACAPPVLDTQLYTFACRSHVQYKNHAFKISVHATAVEYILPQIAPEGVSENKKYLWEHALISAPPPPPLLPPWPLW